MAARVSSGVPRILNGDPILQKYPTLDAYVPNKNPRVTTIFWCRHAESAGNLEGIYSGRGKPGDLPEIADPRLSENGEKQARALNQKFKDLGIQFDGLVRSPMKRTKETIQLAADGLWASDKPIKIKDGGLHERYLAHFEGESLKNPDYVEYRDLEMAFLNDSSKSYEEIVNHKVYPDTQIESIKEVSARSINPLLLIDKEHKGKTFIGGSHSGTTRAVFWEALFNEHGVFIDYEKFKPRNASVLVFEIEEGKMTLKAVDNFEFK